MEDEPDPAAPAAFEETEPQESQEDGVEYDERQIARLNAQLKGVEFVDDRVRWRVLKVSFDAEHEAPVCFYFDAKLGDEGTVDDCEYSGVDEVQQWIATHRRRLKAEAARRNGAKAASVKGASATLAAASPNTQSVRKHTLLHSRPRRLRTRPHTLSSPFCQLQQRSHAL